MKKISAIIIVASLWFALGAIAGANEAPGEMNKIKPLPRDLEIQLSLSALPPYLQKDATVYTLDPDKGFEVARKGTNGFHALVARTGDDTFRGAWTLTDYREDILYPVSFDSAGAAAQLQVFFDAARMQAEGMPPGELKRVMQHRFKSGFYKAPKRAGVSYMLSPILRTYADPDENDKVVTLNIPHIMYYAPNVSNAEIGGGIPGPDNPYPFVILRGPLGYMVQLLDRTESAAITQGYAKLLKRLCTINDRWCLPPSKAQ